MSSPSQFLGSQSITSQSDLLIYGPTYIKASYESTLRRMLMWWLKKSQKRWINERKQQTSWHQHCLLKSRGNWQRRTSTTGTKCSQNWATFCSLMKTLTSCISLASTTLFDLMTMSFFLTFSHMWKFLKNTLIQSMFKWTMINELFFVCQWVCQSGITFSYKYEVQLMAWQQQKQQKCY